MKSYKLHSTAAIVFALLAVFNHCSPVSNENASSPGSKMLKPTEKHDTYAGNSRILVEPLLKFTNNLFGAIRSDKNNVLVSPVSIHAALSMVALGAESGSETSRELSNGLGYFNITTDDYHRAYKSMIESYKKVSKLGLETIQKAALENEGQTEWNFGYKPPVIDFYNVLITKHNKPLFDSYSKRVANFYKSSVEQIDSSKPETLGKVVNKVNQWAKEAGFEQNILDEPELSGYFAVMLLSAVRIQAFWFEDFGEYEREIVFYQFGIKDQPVGGKQLVMSQFRANFVEFCTEDKAMFKHHYEDTKATSGLADKLRKLTDLDCRAVAIGLQGGLSLTIFEPRSVAGQGKELGELARKLFAPNSTRLSSVLSVLDSPDAMVKLNDFRMPKFGFESNTNLKGPLKALGISRLFSETSSELKRIVQGETLCVGEAKHQAMIDVNMFGLKAAGVTKLRLMETSFSGGVPIDIEVNKPFIFMIRNGRIPLFIGQLVKL